MFAMERETVAVAYICLTNKGSIIYLLIPGQHSNQHKTKQAQREGLMPGPYPHLAGPRGLGVYHL